MNTYAICESYWDKTEKKLTRVARKCERLGNPFIFEVIGEEYRTEKNRYGRKVTHKFILVNLEGAAKVEEAFFNAYCILHKAVFLEEFEPNKKNGNW